MTAFFAVHLVVTVVSLTLGTIIGVLGIRSIRYRSLEAAETKIPKSVSPRS